MCVLYVDAGHLPAGYGPREASVFGTHVSHQLAAGLLYLGQPVDVFGSLASRSAVELPEQGRVLQEELAIVLGDMRCVAFGVIDRSTRIPENYWANTTQLLAIFWTRGVCVIVLTIRALILQRK